MLPASSSVTTTFNLKWPLPARSELFSSDVARIKAQPITNAAGTFCTCCLRCTS